jgi:putative transposase
LRKFEETNLRDEKDTEVIKEIVDKSKGTYGYRRVTLSMHSKGIQINHKRVLRLMKQNDLLCNKYTKRSRGYSSFKGEVGKIADNRLDRDFKANSMYEKWVTDVTEFRIPGIDKKLYSICYYVSLQQGDNILQFIHSSNN